MGGGIPAWLTPRGPRKKTKLPKIHETPEIRLGYSARTRDVKGIRRALQEGASVDAFDKNGDNPLHWAAFWGDREIAQLLLEAGADQSIKNQFGRVPLEDAYRGNKRDMTRLLELWSKRGTSQYVARKRRVMEWAVRKGQVDSLEEFINTEKHDFLLQIHADSADEELAKIVKQQERASEHMHIAITHHDCKELELAVGYARTLESMIAEPRHPSLVEAEAKLSEFLEEELGLTHKLEMIEACEFANANIHTLEKTLHHIRTSPLSKRLRLRRATEHVQKLKSELERRESRLTKAMEAVQGHMARKANAKKGEEVDTESVTGDVEALSRMVEEFSKMKPLRDLVHDARAVVREAATLQ